MDIDKLESIKSLLSAINKSEKALVQMIQKGANTTLIKKRLLALKVSLAVLENIWNQVPYKYTQEELIDARNILIGLLPSIKRINNKLEPGSSQTTLSERRIKALELSIQEINNLIDI